MRIIGNDPKTPRQTQVVASGTLSTGDTVVVNSDGTVSAVAEISVSFSAGTPVVVDSTPTNVEFVNTVYDPQNEKVIVIYSYTASADEGYAAVGTVSGSSITFGTPVQFASQAREIGAAYYGSGKIIIVFRNGANFNYGHAIAGTVSGNSISFGTSQSYQNSDCRDNVVGCDPTTGKILIAYKDLGSSGYGYCKGATLSGTTFSFGTRSQYANVVDWQDISFDESQGNFLLVNTDNTNSSYGEIRAVTVSGTTATPYGSTYYNSAATYMAALSYDSTNEKTVIAYRDGGNSNKPTTIVVSLSGTTISLGSETVVDASGFGVYMGAAYNSTDGVHTITYYDANNSNYGTAVEGTVSGTSISFGSPITFESATSSWNAPVYDASTNKVVNAYTDGGNSNRTTATVISNSGSSTNITATNFIGTAQTGASDGNGVVVNIKGAIDENQSGLTAGQSYYVQTDGSLGTTAADPSVFAGTAVSATKLIVKG